MKNLAATILVVLISFVIYHKATAVDRPDGMVVSSLDGDTYIDPQKHPEYICRDGLVEIKDIWGSSGYAVTDDGAAIPCKYVPLTSVK